MKIPYRRTIGKVVLGLTAMLGFSSLGAAPLAIDEASFENIDLGGATWSNNLNNPGSAWLGRDGTNDGDAFVEQIGGFFSEGVKHIGFNNNYYIFQDLGVTYLPNTRYTLTVGVGNRGGQTNAANVSHIGLTNAAPPSDASVTDPTALIAGAMADGTVNASTHTAAGTFKDFSVSFTTDANPPAGNIIIYAATTGAGRGHFDNFRLEEIDFNDNDNDGMPNFWEILHSLDPEVATGVDGPDGDPDGDLVGNLQEFNLNLDPRDSDSDDDNLSDGQELAGQDANGVETGFGATDPLDDDSDDDTVLDGEETSGSANSAYGNTPTNPNDADTDDDLLTDGQEVDGLDLDDFSHGFGPTNPNSIDSDNDNVTDVGEILANTDPNQASSTPAAGSGSSIGINFTGGRSTLNRGIISSATIASADKTAGVLPRATWNNVDGNAPVATTLIDENGDSIATNVTVTGSTNVWSINGTLDNSPAGVGIPANGNAALMQGYLDTNATSTTTVKVNDISYAVYDVVVYMGGDTGNRFGNYTANGQTMANVRHDGAAWDIIGGTTGMLARHYTSFQAITGNHVVFFGVTGSNLTVTATPTANGVRAPINGIQIVNADPGADADSDGLPDGTEGILGTDPGTSDVGVDSDSDDLENIDEFNARTDIFYNDTDDDYILDGEEGPLGLDPLNGDFDNDGLLDGEEDINVDGILDDDETDPTNPDTDGDLVSDGDEDIFGTDPRLVDTDNDTLDDNEEINIYGTDPNNPADPADPSQYVIHTETIGVNFVSARAPAATLDPAAAAGHPLYVQANWNNIFEPQTTDNTVITGDESNITGPTAGVIVDGTGAATSMTVDYTSTTRWSAGNGTGSANALLMTSYWDAGTTLTLGNIPYPYYDVIVYVGADGNARDGLLQLKNTGGAVIAQSGYNTNANLGAFSAADFAISTDTNGSTFPIANVVVFESVSGSSVVIENVLQTNGNSGIFGFQIAEGVAPAAQLAITGFTRAAADQWTLSWTGNSATYTIQASTTLNGDWTNIATGVTSPQTITSNPATNSPRFFRVVEE